MKTNSNYKINQNSFFEKKLYLETYQEEIKIKDKINIFPSKFLFLSKLFIKELIMSKGFWVCCVIIPSLSILFITVAFINSPGRITVNGFYIKMGIIFPTIGLFIGVMPIITHKFISTNQMKRLKNIGITDFDYMWTYLLIGFSTIILSQIIIFWILPWISIIFWTKIYDIKPPFFGTNYNFKYYQEIDYWSFIPMIILFVSMFLCLGYSIGQRAKGFKKISVNTTYFILIIFMFCNWYNLMYYYYGADEEYGKIMNLLAIVSRYIFVFLPGVLHFNILILSSRNELMKEGNILFVIHWTISVLISISIIGLVIWKNPIYFNYSYRK